MPQRMAPTGCSGLRFPAELLTTRRRAVLREIERTSHGKPTLKQISGSEP